MVPEGTLLVLGVDALLLLCYLARRRKRRVQSRKIDYFGTGALDETEPGRVL